jgi:phosphoribosylanthranilate isomerase
LRTRVKICGITQLNDALAAIEAGADALGFVFFEGSPRFIAPKEASHITNNISPFINMIALFVNASNDYVSQVITDTHIDVLQFHGDEDEAFCSSFNKPYLKAVRMQESTDLNQIADDYSTASGLLLDAFDKEQYGGTGHSFDWALSPKNIKLPVILAGGLNHTNVYEAITQTQPYAVDVSSGVEISKGVKNHQLLKQFMQEVKRADE